MTTLTVGVNAQVLSFLKAKLIPYEVADPEDFDLEDWVYEGSSYSAALLNLDIGLGVYACRGVRAKSILLPIIGMMTHDPDSGHWSEKRATFLENGGDDLFQNPCNPRELIASLNSCVRRMKGGTQSIFTYYRNDIVLKVNATRLLVTVGGRELHLTSQEMKLAILLVESCGRVLSKEALLTGLYSLSPDDEPEIKIIDVFICKLRKKFEEACPGGGKFIETIWGRGYALSGSTSPSQEAA